MTKAIYIILDTPRYSISSNVLFLSSETNQWKSGPHEKTTADNANTAQRHCKTGPDGIQPYMGAIAHNGIEHTRGDWNGNTVIHQSPAKVELDPSKYEAAEVDQGEERGKTRGDQDKLGGRDGDIRARSDGDAHISHRQSR